MKKTLYVCGDSFCSLDPDYPGGWVVELQKRHPSLEITSLASPGASNFLIYLQVKQALAVQCDYLIYHATSSVRHEFVANPSANKNPGHENFWNRSYPDQPKHLLCTSWLTPEHSLFLDDEQAKSIRNFYKKYIDPDTEIEKNYLFIRSTLDLIASSSVKNWIWSRGGFEHKNFISSKPWQFDHTAYETTLNLWDYYDRSLTRPFYHISDMSIINTACELYSNMLQLNR